jgi:hypothetical protein
VGAEQSDTVCIMKNKGSGEPCWEAFTSKPKRLRDNGLTDLKGVGFEHGRVVKLT